MTFGLKNTGATYQRVMDYIFHKLIGRIVEIYIDDAMIKIQGVQGASSGFAGDSVMHKKA